MQYLDDLGYHSVLGPRVPTSANSWRRSVAALRGRSLEHGRAGKSVVGSSTARPRRRSCTDSWPTFQLDRNKLDSGNSPMLAPTAMVPNRGVVIAFLGGAERKAVGWFLRELKVWAILGGVTIDLRNAKFAPGVTEIDVTGR